MTDILTRLCLVGAAALFAAWLALRYRGCLARATDALAKVSRARLAAFLFFVAVATVCAQKPGGTNNPPQGASNGLAGAFDGRVEHVERVDSSDLPTCSMFYTFYMDRHPDPAPLFPNVAVSAEEGAHSLVGTIRLCRARR